MGGWKVGVSYERYGYIWVGGDEAATEKQAARIAEEKMHGMSPKELELITTNLEGSVKIDERKVEKI